MRLSHSLRVFAGILGLTVSAWVQASGSVETTFSLTALVVKDALGNVVPTQLAPTSIAQNSYPSSFVYTSGLVDANGDYLTVTDYRRHLDLLAWSTHFTVPSGVALAAQATTSGSFLNTLTATAYAGAFNSSVSAQSEVAYDILIPAHGSVTVSGWMTGHALSTGEPSNQANIPHGATFDTFLLFSPAFLPGEVYRIGGDVSSATAPFAPSEVFKADSFSATFVSPVGFDWYAHLDMIASASARNAALPSLVPEPASWLMAAAGLATLWATYRRRTALSPLHQVG